MKILSRKVLASLLVFITATIFIWFSKISGAEWVSLAIVTVMAYIAGDGVSQVIKYVKKSKAKAALNNCLDSEPIKIGDRLKNLLSMPFLAALFVYGVATVLMWHGKISTTEWNYVAMGTILGYDLLNPMGKI